MCVGPGGGRRRCCGAAGPEPAPLKIKKRNLGHLDLVPRSYNNEKCQLSRSFFNFKHFNKIVLNAYKFNIIINEYHTPINVCPTYLNLNLDKVSKSKSLSLFQAEFDVKSFLGNPVCFFFVVAAPAPVPCSAEMCV